MPSINNQKRECKLQIRLCLETYILNHPDRAESLALTFAMMLANTMPLPELQKWQEQLEELDDGS